MRLDSIFTVLPNEIKTLLGKENSDKWIDILHTKQKETKHDGEYLAKLLLFMVKHDVDETQRTLVCTLLENKKQNSQLSSMAKTAYHAAQISIKKLQQPSMSGKHKADEVLKGQSPEGQLSKKSQKQQTARELNIAQQTGLPNELVTAIHEYVGPPFPGNAGTFSIYCDFFDSLSSDLATPGFGGGVVLALSCEEKNVLVHGMSINYNPQALEHKFSLGFGLSSDKAKAKIVQEYLKEQNLSVDFGQNSYEYTCVVHKKRDALFLVDSLADLHTFSYGAPEKLRNIITSHFDE